MSWFELGCIGYAVLIFLVLNSIDNNLKRIGDELKKKNDSRNG